MLTQQWALCCRCCLNIQTVYLKADSALSHTWMLTQHSVVWHAVVVLNLCRLWKMPPKKRSGVKTGAESSGEHLKPQSETESARVSWRAPNHFRSKQRAGPKEEESGRFWWFWVVRSSDVQPLVDEVRAREPPWERCWCEGTEQLLRLMSNWQLPSERLVYICSSASRTWRLYPTRRAAGTESATIRSTWKPKVYRK